MTAEGKTASFQLDGATVPFEPGQTVIQAALAAGHYIPHLCYHPEFKPHGSCRVCTVEVDGRTVASCTLQAQDGMEVLSQSDRLRKEHQTLVQMLFVEGNHFCPSCEQSGNCRLQAVAYDLDIMSAELDHLFPNRPVDASHPEILLEFNRCILCELCVRASHDVDHKNVFAVSGRGINSHLVINSPSGKLGDSDFAATDKAAHVCPVGAILPKHRGYDQPIGQRLYDKQPVSIVGDVAAHEDDQ